MPTKKIYTNTIAQIGAKILTALISIVMIKILTNYLDIAGYGLYSKLYNYLSIFAVIADLGLYTITVRELSVHAWDQKMQEKIAANILSLRTFSGILIIGLALIIWCFLDGYNSREAMIGIFIVSLFTLSGLINSSLMSYLQAILKTEFSLISNTSGKILTLWIIILASVFAWEAPHTERFIFVMLAWLAGNLLMMALTWWYANKWHHIHFLWDKEYIKYILKISAPYWLALFLNVIFFKIDVILLSILEPAEIADTVIALYSLPMKIVEVGMMYGTIFLNSLLPVLTTAIEKHDGERVRNLIKKAFFLLFSWGIVWSLVIFFGADLIIRLISTPEFITESVYGIRSVDVFRVVGWVFLFYFVSSLFTYVLIAEKSEKKMLYINACVASVNIIGNIILIPRYSLMWSAWATVGSQILLLLLTGYTAYKSYKK